MDLEFCSQCKRNFCKLWRPYQRLSPLYCIECHNTEPERKKKVRNGETDQLYWAVPYIPTEDGGGAYGYTSVPNELVKKWKSLPF